MSTAPGHRRGVPAAFVGLLLPVALGACGSGHGGLVAPAPQAAATATGAVPSGGSSSDAACTDGGAVAGAGSAPTDAASPIVRSSDDINVLGGRELLPAGIPIPPDVTVGQVLLVRGVAYTADLEVPDANATYAYLLTALPADGYAIDLCERTPQQAGVGFTGRGCGADSTFTLSPAKSTLECSLSG